MPSRPLGTVGGAASAVGEVAPSAWSLGTAGREASAVGAVTSSRGDLLSPSSATLSLAKGPSGAVSNVDVDVEGVTAAAS